MPRLLSLTLGAPLPCCDKMSATLSGKERVSHGRYAVA